jgi:hypothetical protein
MKKYLVFLGAMLFATPAAAVDSTDLFAVGATHFVLTTHTRVTSGVIGNFGSYLRVGCDVDCWVAVSATDFQGTHGVDSSATSAIYIPAEAPIYMKAKGEKYVIGLGASTGTIYITEMSP